jgi:NADH:ubiquinone oxidoreductase subunit 4 (subunit M)
MHNRQNPKAESRDIRFRDAVVLVPLCATIIALALYPQVAIEKGEPDIDDSIKAAQIADGTPTEEAGHPVIQVIR